VGHLDHEVWVIANPNIRQSAAVAFVARLVVGMRNKSDATVAETKEVSHRGVDAVEVVDLDARGADCRDMGIDEDGRDASAYDIADIACAGHDHNAVATSAEEEVHVVGLPDRIMVGATRQETIPCAPGGDLEGLE
jgi:hypothetical protein